MNKSRLKQTLPTVLMTTDARKYYIRDLARLVGNRLTTNFKEDIKRVRNCFFDEYIELNKYLENNYQELLKRWMTILLITHYEELKNCIKSQKNLEKALKQKCIKDKKDLNKAFETVIETRNGLIYLHRVKTTKKNEHPYDYFFECFVDSVLTVFKKEPIEKTMEDVKKELIETLNKELSELTTRR